MMELLEMLFHFIAALYPPLYAIMLVLAAALLGFCSYVFFAAGNLGGGATFAVLALVCLILLLAGLRKGWFSK